MYGRCSCALRRWREPRWFYLPICLFPLRSRWVAFRQIFVFLARYSSFDLRHRPLNPLGSASPPQVAQCFQELFATCWGRRVNMRRIRVEREKTEGDDDKHSLAGVPRAVCVTHKSLSHKKHTIAAKPSQKSSAKGLSFVDSGPSTQTFSHAQKHANKRPPFQTLVTIHTTAYTHFPWWRVLSSVIKRKRNTDRDRDKKKERRNEREEEKGEKSKRDEQKDEGKSEQRKKRWK